MFLTLSENRENLRPISLDITKDQEVKQAIDETVKTFGRLDVVVNILELHRLLELPPPRHPLISIFRFEDIKYYDDDKKLEAVPYHFYCVALKKNFTGPMQYSVTTTFMK